MGDTQQDNETAETPEGPVEGAETATEEAHEPEVKETSEEPAEGDSEATEDTQDEDAKDDGDHNELPDWGRKQLTKARNEAKNLRRRLAEANDTLSKAVKPEDFEAAKAELAATHLALETERIANRHGLPDELRGVLKGDTAEEIEAHAAILGKYVTSPKVDPSELSGGLNPGDDEGPLDPRALARQTRRY